jgi:hypothetical protein
VTGAVFLSASVPDPRRAPEYARQADAVAISAAVTALVYVTLGRRLLVWGGHPAITPMIWAIAESLGIDYGSWVRLYQSRFFEDEFPDDNRHFHNVTFTQAVEGDVNGSLRIMRERMFRETRFDAAVFIGGMGGIVQEYELFRELQPKAAMFPVVSTGGATLDVARRMRTPKRSDLGHDLDYIALFHRRLRISVKERRFRHPGEQPPQISKRMWSRGDP